MIANRHTYTGNQNVGKLDTIQKVESHSPPHLSELHVDSTDRLAFTTYAAPRFEVNSEIIRRSVNKMAMSEITIHSNIPNVNGQNLTIRFESDVGSHEVDLITGFYTVPELMDHIVLRLNTVSGASLLTFSATPIYGNLYNISAVGGNFRFLESTHITRAEPLSGLHVTDIRVNSLLVNADGLYTRFIDFISTDFKESQILENLFTKDYDYSIINHFYRYDILDGTKPYNDKLQIKNLSYSSIRNKDKNILTMALYNQFGDLIYAPKITYGTQTFIIDIFKYELKLSISA